VNIDDSYSQVHQASSTDKFHAVGDRPRLAEWLDPEPLRTWVSGFLADPGRGNGKQMWRLLNAEV